MLREDNEILRQASVFSAGELDLPQPLIMAFIDDMRREGHAVESTCRVLTAHGCNVAVVSGLPGQAPRSSHRL